MHSVPRHIVTILLAALACALSGAPRLQLDLDREYYTESIQNNLYLKTTLITGEQSAETVSWPANLVFLVDRSGSMEGDKLATLKSALQSSLSQLASADRVSLIAYGSNIETLIPSTPLDQLSNASATIENLSTDGGSALYAGLEQAQTEILRSASPHSLNRILLICDGPPNKGQIDSDALKQLAKSIAQDNTSIATFALGQEAPTQLLSAIAELSHGQSYEIDRLSTLEEKLTAELQSLNPTIGTDAILEIEFQRSLKIVESIGREAQQSFRKITFGFDTLLANQKITTIVQATISPSVSTSFKLEVAKVKLSYQPATPPDAPRISIETEATARFTPSRERSFETIVPHVYQTVCEYEVLDAVREAVEAVNQNKAKKALRDLKKLSRNIRSVAKDIDELQPQASLDQLNKAIDDIESAIQSPIEQRAITDTLYPALTSPSSDQ